MRTALFKVPSDGYGEETVNSQENKPRDDSDIPLPVLAGRRHVLREQRYRGRLGLGTRTRAVEHSPNFTSPSTQSCGQTPV